MLFYVSFRGFTPCREHHRQLIGVLIGPVLPNCLHHFVVHNAIPSWGQMQSCEPESESSGQAKDKKGAHTISEETAKLLQIGHVSRSNQWLPFFPASGGHECTPKIHNGGPKGGAHFPCSLGVELGQTRGPTGVRIALAAVEALQLVFIDWWGSENQDSWVLSLNSRMLDNALQVLPELIQGDMLFMGWHRSIVGAEENSLNRLTF